jgi:hypothetical protein
MVIVAIFPTLQAAGEWPSLNPYATMADVNAHGNFRDLLFVIVPASAVALSTWMEFLSNCVIRKRVDKSGLITVGFLALVGVLANIFILGTGLVGFSLIPAGVQTVGPVTFLHCSNAIVSGLAISFFTEVAATAANEIYGAERIA